MTKNIDFAGLLVCCLVCCRTAHWFVWTKQTIRVCFHQSWALPLALSCLSRPRVFTITIKAENERHTWGFSGVCLRFLVFFFFIRKLLARGDFCISSCVKHADFWHCPSGLRMGSGIGRQLSISPATSTFHPQRSHPDATIVDILLDPGHTHPKGWIEDNQR